jgi:hypothetical protein
MTLDECVSQGLNVLCASSNGDSTLKNIEQMFVIASCIALIVAAYVGWRQLKLINIQIKEARESATDQVKSSKDVGRLTATLNLLINIQTNPRWVENRQKYILLRDGTDGLKKYAQETSENAMVVRSMLNQYELIATGIHAGILDEQMYRTYYRGTLLKDWRAGTEFIHKERQENPKYWVELELLVKRFEQPE